MPDPTPPFSSISTLIPSVPSIPTSEPLRQVTKGQVTKSNDKDGFILQTTTNGPGEFVAGALGMGAAAITQPPWRVTLGGEVFTADNHDEIVVHGQTLKPGGSAVTVDGSTISLSAGDGGQVVADVGGLIVTLDGARQTGQDVVTGDGSRLRWTRWNAAVLGGWLVVMMVL